jgi:hypothetical protein
LFECAIHAKICIAAMTVSCFHVCLSWDVFYWIAVLYFAVLRCIDAKAFSICVSLP